MTKDNVSNRLAVIGSKLRLDVLLGKIESELKDVIGGLKQAADDYKACTHDESKSERMRQAFDTTNTLFNEMLDTYRQIRDISSSIAKVARGELPTKGLDREISNCQIRIEATDEGFAESIATIVNLPNPEERMDTSLSLIRELVHSIKGSERRITALSERLSYNGDGAKDTNASEHHASLSLRESVKQRIQILESRLDAAVEIFFRSRVESLERVSAPTRELARLIPDGSEATRKFARIHNATDCTDTIAGCESTFKNPSSLISRTGRTIPKRRRSA